MGHSAYRILLLRPSVVKREHESTHLNDVKLFILRKIGEEHQSLGRSPLSLFLSVARLANVFAVPPPPSICIPVVAYKNFVPKDDKNAAVTKKPAGKRKL